MRVIAFAAVLFAAMVPGGWSASEAQTSRTPPYWASIDQPVARMRTGPSTEYPVKWIYKRKNLPVKIIDRYSSWRKVEDPDGDQGWMHVRLLSGTETGLVVGDIRPMRDSPASGARILWRAEPGVVGKLSDCEAGWCLFDVAGRRGYIRIDHIWGTGAL